VLVIGTAYNGLRTCISLWGHIAIAGLVNDTGYERVGTYARDRCSDDAPGHSVLSGSLRYAWLFTGCGLHLPGFSFSQVFNTLGYGLYFPWAIPALYNGATGNAAALPGLISYLLVVLVGGDRFRLLRVYGGSTQTRHRNVNTYLTQVDETNYLDFGVCLESDCASSSLPISNSTSSKAVCLLFPQGNCGKKNTKTSATNMKNCSYDEHMVH